MPLRVLFVCEGNRVRSQLAEALLRFHGGGRFEAYSAGIRPGAEVLPETIAELSEAGVPADSLRPQHYSDYADQEFDWVITVCDRVLAEDPPLPKGKRIHWSVEDPADAQARGLTLPEAVRENRVELRSRIVRFIEAQGCVFCKIVAGEVTASFVYNDDLVSAFMDLRPVTEGHLLVIPREHYVTADEMPEEIAGRVSRVGGMLAKALAGSGVPFEGYNLWVANGEAAGQEVFHVHLHVLPRYRDDGFGLRFPDGYGAIAARESLDELAKAIRATMESDQAEA